MQREGSEAGGQLDVFPDRGLRCARMSRMSFLRVHILRDQAGVERRTFDLTLRDLDGDPAIAAGSVVECLLAVGGPPPLDEQDAHGFRLKLTDWIHQNRRLIRYAEHGPFEYAAMNPEPIARPSPRLRPAPVAAARGATSGPPPSTGEALDAAQIAPPASPSPLRRRS